MAVSSLIGQMLASKGPFPLFAKKCEIVKKETNFPADRASNDYLECC